MNSNIQTIITIWGVLIFLCFSGNMYAQSTEVLFKVVLDAETVLSNAEFNRFTNLENEKVKEKALIDITGLEQTLRSSGLSIPLKGMEHSLKSTNFSNAKEGSFTFKGTLTEALGEVYLYQTDGYLYGNIHIDSLAYQIEPINKKYAVLLRRDYSEDICPLGEEHGEKEDSGGNQQNDSSKSKSAPMNDPVIDVMVLFSNQAAAATSNMQALAEGSIQSSNDAFSNSDVGVSFNLVHYQQVNYNDSGNSLTDINRLEGTSDGYIDNIHSLRDQYGADIVMLMVNSTDACGRASEIGANSAEAFAVTVNSCSIGNYTFAHEVGHLAGARHDNDPNSNPYAYGHGFRYNPGYWRTVMAVYDSQVNRIPYWSNPDKTYGGVAMGTSSWRDNARVWDVRAATMAGFKTPPPSISAPTNLVASSGGGGFGQVVLDWDDNSEPDLDYYKVYRKHMGVDPGFQHIASPSGSNYDDYEVSTTMGTSQEFRYYVTAVNTSSQESNQSNTVYVDGESTVQKTNPGNPEALPEIFSLQQNYPNPFNPATQIKFALPEHANVKIQVYNIMGQQVATLVNTDMSAGFHEISFDAGALSSGVYITRMEAIGESGTRFNRELKMQLIK